LRRYTSSSYTKHYPIPYVRHLFNSIGTYWVYVYISLYTTLLVPIGVKNGCNIRKSKRVEGFGNIK
jgi:hypothetical protein